MILGNPPYNAFSGVSPKEEQGLVEPYKQGLISEWGIKKFNLDDLYIRFFRLAEQRIAERTKKGVVCYVSNFSYLSDPSFVVMRQRFLGEFDKLWFDCMNGDSRETGKLTPEGKPDPSVFSTQYNREGIRVGTAIALMVRQENRTHNPSVRFRHFWGVTKRADLLESIKAKDFDAQYESANPDNSNRLSFRTSDVASQYLGWSKLVDLCAEAPISGLQEMRKGALMAIDRKVLEERMQTYYDHSVDWDTLKTLRSGLTENGGSFDAKAARAKVQDYEKFDLERVTRYALYPFDLRWCYYSTVSPLWNRPRPALVSQQWTGNSFIVTRMMAERPNEQITITITSALPDYHLLRPNAVAIPIRICPIPSKKSKKVANQDVLFDVDAVLDTTPTANLSKSARAYLAHLDITNPDVDAETAGLIWMHALAIGYSPAYLTENADGIRQDWPRIPLPNSQATLSSSAELGKQIATLLDTETPVVGVTSGKIRTELKAIAIISRVGNGQLNPDAGDLSITANWGHAGQKGVTMPGKGKIIERPYTPEELTFIEEGAVNLGITTEHALAQLGKTTCDIYLNDIAYWKNIPANVWNYTIGGYQVIKKWLSYREEKLLGRSLTKEEVREVTNMTRRIAAILLLEPKLDANYKLVKQSTYNIKSV